MRPATLVALCLVLSPWAAVAQEGRTKSRLLYSFEEAADAAKLGKSADNGTLITVMDNGVTHGKNCARWVVRKGADYGSLELDRDAIRDWRDFDYLAIDVFTDEGGPDRLVVELWDGLSKNYATRCTFEDVKLRPGRQTLLYPIGKPRRNGKEGRSWEELEPKDKIDLAKLTKVKLFLTPPKDRDAVMWIDNVRLLQEDAAKPKLKVPLPAGAKAYKFGSAGESLPGFVTVSPAKPKTDAYSLTGRDLAHGGAGWPDALSGTFVRAAEGEKLRFSAKLPPGDYRVLLCAGMVLPTAPPKGGYLLRVNDRTVIDDEPTAADYHSTKYLHRFLGAGHHPEPEGLWRLVVERMCPAHSLRVKVGDAGLEVTAVNHFLAAVIVEPVGDGGEEGETWAKVLGAVRKARLDAFLATLPAKRPALPAREAVAGPPVVVWQPAHEQRLLPWTPPPKADVKAIRRTAAPGELVVFRLAVTAYVEAKVPVSATVVTGPDGPTRETPDVLVQHFRSDGETTSEAHLLRSETADFPAPMTRGIVVTMRPAADAKPGVYTSTLRVGKADEVELSVDVLPIKLERNLPLSLGMYYSPLKPAGLPEADRRRLVKEQLAFMRSLGMTAAPVGSATVTRVAGDKVSLSFDDTLIDLASEVGMGAHPGQYMMGTALGVGRGIGRRLPGSLGAKVDQNPGIELKQPGFRGLFTDAMKQQKAHFDRKKLPVAVEIVDEPREVPNPWNRNLADTLAYGAMLKEAGLTTFVTPMGDSNGGKDYSVLADHADVLSVHAWKASEKLMTRTRAAKKTLWLYNTGMDRFSWGFYAWRAGAVGRWEWHFCFPEDTARGGYPGREWHNPFTGSHGLASMAPPTYPGGIVWNSAFLDVAEGITDYAYLLTLEKRLAERKDSPRHAATVKDATAFLAALRRGIPEYPGVKGLANAEDGALVGMGLEDEAKHQTPKWREKIAGFLRGLE